MRLRRLDWVPATTGTLIRHYCADLEHKKPGRTPVPAVGTLVMHWQVGGKGSVGTSVALCERHAPRNETGVSSVDIDGGPA